MNITTDQLIWDKVSRTFCQEASSLDIKPGITTNNFKVTNIKTGNFRHFNYVRTMFYGPEHEREVGGWVYKSHDGIELHVFND